MKQINNYDNYYINEDGKVYNSNTKKYLKGSIGENGYLYYRLSKNNKKKMFYAHRLVAENFIDNPNNYEVVNHIDGNKLNNNVNNLEWVTYSENTKHAHDNNLINFPRKKEYFKENLPNEVWKQISGYNYSISNLGRIKNEKTNLLLKPSITCGYYKVRLSNNGKVKDFMIHHLVYCLFNEVDSIPNGYVIDHIDGDKLNNKLNNLRLITLSDNVLNALYKTKTNRSCKKVAQYDLNENLLNTFDSCSLAARALNLDSSTISKVCRGINKTHGGFIFKYID